MQMVMFILFVLFGIYTYAYGNVKDEFPKPDCLLLSFLTSLFPRIARIFRLPAGRIDWQMQSRDGAALIANETRRNAIFFRGLQEMPFRDCLHQIARG